MLFQTHSDTESTWAPLASLREEARGGYSASRSLWVALTFTTLVDRGFREHQNLSEPHGISIFQRVRSQSLSSVMSNSLGPRGLDGSPWNSPAQNTGVGSLSILQGI